MKPLVSIIIPVYKVEKYLDKCIASVVNQTYTNLEIILVDDGSPDNCPASCDQWKERDSRITVIHQENGGLSHARNEGLKIAKGGFIAFLDSDDWLELNAVEHLINIARSTDADIVACRFYQEFKDKTEEESGPESEFIAEGGEILKSMVIDRKLTEDVWNKFYKSRLFEGVRFPDGRIFEDKATTYKILQKARKLAYTPACLIHYRNRANSLSNIHSMKSLEDYWLAFRERFEILGPLSEEYYKTSLSDCICAASRMWRWVAGCTKAEKREAKEMLDEMQAFVEAHRSEIMKGPYSGYVKAACCYTRFRNPLVFSLLYSMNALYRNRNRNQYFEE